MQELLPAVSSLFTPVRIVRLSAIAQSTVTTAPPALSNHRGTTDNDYLAHWPLPCRHSRPGLPLPTPAPVRSGTGCVPIRAALAGPTPSAPSSRRARTSGCTRLRCRYGHPAHAFDHACTSPSGPPDHIPALYSPPLFLAATCTPARPYQQQPLPPHPLPPVRHAHHRQTRHRPFLPSQPTAPDTAHTPLWQPVGHGPAGRLWWWRGRGWRAILGGRAAGTCHPERPQGRLHRFPAPLWPRRVQHQRTGQHRRRYR